MAHSFGFLDNLDPIAPMDSVSPPESVTSVGFAPLPAEQHNSLYIPPYRNPDAFPVVHGGECTCETPPLVPPTQKQKDWARKVAKQLGVKVRDLPKPMSPEGLTKCACPDENGQVAFHWAKLEPIGNSRKFKISPADISYSAGNYWEPSLRGGLAAPQDKMPIEHYPLQAVADEIEHLPSTGQEDRISSKFARYIDQVEARSLMCDGDGVSEQCSTECIPGDPVVLEIGPTRIDAKITTTHINGAVVVEFAPRASKGLAGAAPCPLQAACSIYRNCRKQFAWCVEHEGKRSRDYMGNLKLTLACPRGTMPCSTVQQVVAARYLRKDGRVCKAAGPIATKPPPL